MNFEEPVNLAEDFAGHGTCFGNVDLIEHDQRVRGLRGLREVANQLAFDRLGSGRPVLAVETVQFNWWLSLSKDQRLAVSEGATVGGEQEVLEGNSRDALERVAQLKSFTIIAGKTDGVNRADSESGKIVHNRSGAAGLGPDADHVMHGQTGLDRGLGLDRK